MTQFMSWSVRMACPRCDRVSAIRACRDRNDEGVCTDCFMRAALTRALTAQAWAVACAAFDWTRDGDCSPCGYLAEDLARLPAPADLAAEMLGVEP